MRCHVSNVFSCLLLFFWAGICMMCFGLLWASGFDSDN